MKLLEISHPKLHFNTQALLAREVREALQFKFGFITAVHLYDNGTGTISIALKKPYPDDPDFLGDIIKPWLRENLTRLMGGRKVTSLQREDNWEGLARIGTGTRPRAVKVLKLHFSFSFEL